MYRIIEFLEASYKGFTIQKVDNVWEEDSAEEAAEIYSGRAQQLKEEGFENCTDEFGIYSSWFKSFDEEVPFKGREEWLLCEERIIMIQIIDKEES